MKNDRPPRIRAPEREKLKPCPFCGGDARLILVNGPLPHVVDCTRCHAQTARCRQKNYAVIAWQRRS